MKEISLRELHRRTGAWVRAARKYGSIIVRDRNVAVARIVPVSEEPPVNVFENWKPHRKLREGAVEHDVFEALMGQFEQDLEDRLWYLVGPSEELFRQVHAFFATLDGTVFLRSLDALHLITARSEGFAHIYSNDRHLLGACVHANLAGIDPVTGHSQSRR
jgi:antitoxin (DNA-binding transcriptional repressor) of toxin-antitoxin stability system